MNRPNYLAETFQLHRCFCVVGSFNTPKLHSMEKGSITEANPSSAIQSQLRCSIASTNCPTTMAQTGKSSHPTARLGRLMKATTGVIRRFWHAPAMHELRERPVSQEPRLDYRSVNRDGFVNRDGTMRQARAGTTALQFSA